MANCPKCGIRLLGNATVCTVCDGSGAKKTGGANCPKCGIRLLGGATSCPVCDSPEARLAQERKAENEQKQKWRQEDKQYRNSKLYGSLNRKIVCPQCQTSGHVHTQYGKQKKGISGAKATGAVLTAGISVLATGLSRKEYVTKAHCTNCGSDWAF